MKTQTDQPTPYAKALHADRAAAQEAEKQEVKWVHHGDGAVYFEAPKDGQFLVANFYALGQTGKAKREALAEQAVRAVNEYDALRDAAGILNFAVVNADNFVENDPDGVKCKFIECATKALASLRNKEAA